MRLTTVAVRNAKAKEQSYKLFDGQGLYLLVHRNGGKYWQLKYRYLDKEKTLSIGVSPATSLAEARDGATRARQQIKAGVDPSAARKEAKLRAKAESENSLKTVALEWHKNRSHLWTPHHATKVLRGLTTEVFPSLGWKAINQITPQEILSILRRMEGRGVTYSAHRIQQVLGQIFRYAVACGKAERDVTPDLRGAISPARKEHFKRLSHNELPEFMSALRNYSGEDQTRIATEILVLTMVRTNELRAAEWKEFDWANAEWRIPAHRMKMRKEHIVPLSRQVVGLFMQQQKLTGDYEHVFPNRNRPTTYISENTILYAIYRMGFHNRATAHGFRATASTILNEHGFNADVIERQLAHCERNQVRATYNHAQYLKERRVMMQWWADYVEEAVRGAVI